jgi:hypothetical protein
MFKVQLTVAYSQAVEMTYCKIMGTELRTQETGE